MIDTVFKASNNAKARIGSHPLVRSTVRLGISASFSWNPKALRELAAKLRQVADELEPESRPAPVLCDQARTILKHLQDEGTITVVEASAVYKVRSLPRRIADLRENDYLITTSMRKDPTGQRYARYYYQGHADDRQGSKGHEAA